MDYYQDDYVAPFNDRFPADDAFDPAPNYDWYYSQVELLNPTPFEDRWPASSDFAPQADSFDSRFYYGVDGSYGYDPATNFSSMSDYFDAGNIWYGWVAHYEGFSFL